MAVKRTPRSKQLTRKRTAKPAKADTAKRTAKQPATVKVDIAKRRTKSRASSGKPSTGDELAEYNRLRALMGLPSVTAKVTANVALDEANKLTSLAGKKSALDIINTMYAGEGPVAPTGTIFHWWGQFSAELPAPFTLPSGGHGYAEARDLEHATITFAKLRDWVLAQQTSSKDNLKLTKTHEWAGISNRGDAWYRWMLADERQMTVLFKTRARLTRAEKRGRIAKLA